MKSFADFNSIWLRYKKLQTLNKFGALLREGLRAILFVAFTPKGKLSVLVYQAWLLLLGFSLLPNKDVKGYSSCLFVAGNYFGNRESIGISLSALAKGGSISNGNSGSGNKALRQFSHPMKLSQSLQEYVSKELSSNDMSHVKVLSKLYDIPSGESSSSLQGQPSDMFGSIFRQCAPYIAMHRGATMVVHIPGNTLRDRKHFDGIMDDVSIMHLLGVKIVLVVGVRSLLDERLLQEGNQAQYYNGMRITDERAMKILKEESGTARFEIESALARGFRGMTEQSGINVVSGNLFYSAKPLGVRDGIDFRFTGEVRRIDVDNFRKRLDSGDIVLVTSLGYSTSGEVYNVPSESLAAECAARLKATKIIYLTDGQGLLDTRNNKVIQSLRLSQATALLDRWGIRQKLYNYVEDDTADSAELNAVTGAKELDLFILSSSSSSPSPSQEMMSNGDVASVTGFMRLIARCVYALTGGVKRGHLCRAYGGAILKELYTRDGSGMLISRDMYEGIRQAEAEDLRSIKEIIRPLEEEGILVHRTNEELMKEIEHCFVMTRDNSVLALGLLKPFSDTHAEVACLAVHPNFRKEGRGELLLTYLERRAVLMGLSHVFVLSTRTMQWFEERGFALTDPSALPSTKYYNKERGSKVYIKKLGSQRDVEAEELLWNIT